MQKGGEHPGGHHDTLAAPDEGAPSLGDPNASPVAKAALIGGRYRVLALVGSGGMGSVFRALDTELDEVVALKFLRSDLVGSPSMLERFRREVKLARKVTHTNVARVFDIGEHASDKFLTMEFVEGEPLSALLERERALRVERLIAIARPLCAGLAAAHAAGVVHRDLKPDNVMLERGGRVVITDFGIARSFDVGETRATMGGVVGTPAYMAPEQVEGSLHIDRRADIYALGVMLFELATGELPFQGATPIMMAAARLTAAAPELCQVRPNLPRALSHIVQRCLARNPDDRFGDMAELGARLEESLGEAAPGAAPGERSTLVMTERAPRAFHQTAVGERTVAVLPFRNLDAPDDAYLAEGMTDELIDTLSMVRGLRVRPRSAVARVRGAQGGDIRELGRELDVQVIVEGSVRRRGDQLRVTARVLSVAEELQLWAQRFDRPAGDALVVSDEVAGAVAAALAAAPTAPRDAPTDPEAIDLYLRGRAEFQKLTAPGLARAIDLFEAAHQRAPRDPNILGAHARACSRLWFFGTGDDGELARLATESADRALALAPDNGEALLARAQVHFAVPELAEAARLAKRAISRAPLLTDAHELLGRIAFEVGPVAAALPILKRAHKLDPHAQAPIIELAKACALDGDFAGAARLFDDNPPVVSSTGRLATFARFVLWDDDRSRWLERLRAPQPEQQPGPGVLVNAVLRLVKVGRVEAEIMTFLTKELARPHRPKRYGAFLLQLAAEMHGWSAQFTAALDLIEQAIDLGLFDLVWLERVPPLRRLHGHPRFEQARRVVAARAADVRAVLNESAA